MTEAPPPCEACGQDSDFQRRQAIKICDVESENRQLKFDLESAQSINERKDALIRALSEERNGARSLLAEAVERFRGDTDFAESQWKFLRRAERALGGGVPPKPKGDPDGRKTYGTPQRDGLAEDDQP